MNNQLPKLIVLLGPTASGKTEWGFSLAKAFNGEILSADSRQIYRKMDIGTAKEKNFFGVPHHLIDFLDPGKPFTVAEFRDRAFLAMGDITARGRIPILAGGTGLYISAIVDNWTIPPVPANIAMRRSLAEKDTGELLRLLAVIDPNTATRIDPHNKRRMIRALEVSILSGRPFSAQRTKGAPRVDAIQIGIAVPRELLNVRIGERVDAMMARGLPKEVETLLKQKYDWSLPSMSGIGYREFRPFFEGKATMEEVADAIKKDTRQFARRQMTWFRRDKRIQWVKEYEDAERRVREFLGL